MDLPAWLAVGPAPPLEDAGGEGPLAEGAVARVAAPRATARALVAADDAVLAVDARGVRDAADATLATGFAAGAVPPGDMQAVRRRLATLGPRRVLLVDPDPDLAEGVRATLASLAPTAVWIALVADGPAAPCPADPAGCALALLPRGLPRFHGAGAAPTVPTDPGRHALAARTACPAGVGPAAAVVLRALEPALDLALDAPLRGDEVLADLLALEWLADHHPDADEAGRAAAAAVRLRAAWGQPGNAQAVLKRQLGRAAAQSQTTEALLDQAEGDLLLGIGDPDGAAPCHRRATRRLRRAGAMPLLVRFARRRAERLLVRGHTREAARLLREVRPLAREWGTPAEVSATVRASADAALAAGELLGAEALYDEAATHPAPLEEAALRSIGQAALALALGDRARARAALAPAAPAHPLARGAAAAVRAVCALHADAPDEALRAAREAVGALAMAGDDLARGRALHLLAEMLAANGAARDAAETWLDALRVQVRVQDLVGLRRTLRAAADHEAATGDDALAARLRAALDTLRQATLPYGIPDYGTQ